jgi:hypothetical protein
VKVSVSKPPNDGYFSCVVTQAGFMAVYTKYCDVGRGEERKTKESLVPVMRPGTRDRMYYVCF